MLLWLVAAAVGLAAAALQYGRGGGGGWLPAVLRVLAVAVLIGLWVDAPIGRGARLRPEAALDVSASWLRSGDTSAYRAAIGAVTSAGADSVFLVGDSLRAGRPPAVPNDVRTRIRPAVEHALAAGRSLVLVTDGELDDPDALAELPAGSRIVVVPHRPALDGGLGTLDAPRSAVAGDTIELRATVVAGPAGAPAGTVAFNFEGHPATPSTSVSVDALAPRGERSVSVRAPVPAGDGAHLIRAVWSAAGDTDGRNDTLAIAIDVSPAAGAVFVSTSPDEDARYALAVLRGALALPTRGFFRVATGQWRLDGGLAPVAEADVRRAVATAPLVVLHGDTAIFGPPRTASRGSLALLVSPGGPSAPTAADEWYATGAPPSPLAAGLAGIPWDSLPPIDVAPTAATGEWQGLEAKRTRRYERRVPVVGSTIGNRRLVVVTASGLWRWRFRGGVSADAYAALWGGIFDWLAAERRDLRPAIPADALVREGDPIRWRRGAGLDSVVSLVLAKRARGAHPDTLAVRFPPGSATSETPPLAAGVYDIRTSGGPALLVVNASREWLPRAPTTRSGRTAGIALAGASLHLRSIPWAYVLVVVVLCAEWLWRRRVGLR